MKKISILLMLVLFCGGGIYSMKNKCVKKISVQRADSPWRDMTGSYEEERASMKVKSVLFEAMKFEGIAGLEKYIQGGEPLIFRARGKKIVGINKKYFSDIERADATRISGSDLRKIGICSGFKSMTLSPQALAEFLVESQIIITYWHIGSELCLENESKTASEYTAYFTGFHTYFTNEKNTDPLRFAVKINLTTGEMQLSGY